MPASVEHLWTGPEPIAPLPDTPTYDSAPDTFVPYEGDPVLSNPGPSSWETNGAGEWTFYDDNPGPTYWPHGTPELIGPPVPPPGGEVAIVQLAGLDDSMALSPWIYGTW